jgi:hypothetical protein
MIYPSVTPKSIVAIDIEAAATAAGLVALRRSARLMVTQGGVPTLTVTQIARGEKVPTKVERSFSDHSAYAWSIELSTGACMVCKGVFFPNFSMPDVEETLLCLSR